MEHHSVEASIDKGSIATLEKEPLAWIHGRRLGGRDCKRYTVDELRAAHKARVARAARDWLGQGGLRPYVPPRRWHLDDRVAAARHRATCHPRRRRA